MNRHPRAALIVLILLALTLQSGCDRSTPTLVSGGWVTATSMVRMEDPADAALEAAKIAHGRLGERTPARAVIFFECFDDVGASEAVTGSIRSIFPDALIVGCSSAGVATADGGTGDRAVAMLVLGGEAGRLTTAYMPETTESAEQAGQLLNRDLGPSAGPTAVILLVDPRTVQQFNWDPNDLLTGVLAGRSGQTVVFGGLAAGRGKHDISRIYHQERGYTDGVVALQISGPIDWAFDVQQELLQVGGVYRARNVHDYTVGELAETGGGGVKPAQEVIKGFLIAQDLPDGHVARLVGNRNVPLGFSLAPQGAIRLPTRIGPDERLVVMQPGTRIGRARVLASTLQTARLGMGLDGMPLSLTILPPGANNAYLDELERVHTELQKAARSHPSALAFMSKGLFVPLPDEAGRIVHHYVEHSTATLQVAKPAGVQIHAPMDTGPAPTTDNSPRMYGPDGQVIIPEPTN